MSVDFAPRYRFTVDEFHRMGEVGIFSEDDRVELINGEIVQRAPIRPRHADCVRKLDRWLQRLLGEEALVSAQQPLKLDNDGEPVPDIAILRARGDGYSESHPVGPDALLVIEVADSSVLFDRNVKSAMYAGGGVPEYWVVDLPRSLVAVFGSPENGRYTIQRDYWVGDSWSAPALGERIISTEQVLGRS